MSESAQSKPAILPPLKLLRERTIALDRPLVMGIVNVTPDSFSDGGQFLQADHAVGHALKMIEEGADLIDIGGESSRPGADSVPIEDELQRVVPVVEQLRSQTDIPISVDTYKAEVADASLKAGADIINDISALRMDPEMVRVLAQSGAPVILMHMLGTPATMQQSPHYSDCVEEVSAFFVQRIAFAVQHGIARERIIVDPGIGFGKRLEDNLDLLGALHRFTQFGLPLLVGASRKSFISRVTGAQSSPTERLGGSIAAAVVARQRGANILRVHDVAATIEAIKVAEAITERT